MSLTKVGADGRRSMTVTIATDPLDNAVTAVRRCIAAEQVDLSDALLIAPSPTPDFGDRLAHALDIPRTSVLTAVIGNTHSAATVFAYVAGADALAGHPDRTLLWIVAGGPSAACMSYRRS